MADIFTVRWRKRVALQLEKVPRHIARKFYAWVSAVHMVGIRRVRLSPGFHDEPLLGDRGGERSIRLNRAFRAIYRETALGAAGIIEVVEVAHHDY